jgi:hypothetical protein
LKLGVTACLPAAPEKHSVEKETQLQNQNPGFKYPRKGLESNQANCMHIKSRIKHNELAST